MSGKIGQKRENIKFARNLADLILQGLEDGYTLTSLLKSNPKLPPYRTIMRWKRQNPEFDREYRVARESQAEKWLDELKDIASEPFDDTLNSADKYFEINKRNIKINTTKFLITKFAPKSFGEKPVEIQQIDKQANQIQITNYNEVTSDRLLPTSSLTLPPLSDRLVETIDIKD